MLIKDTFLLNAVAKISNNSPLANLLANPGGSTTDNISTLVLKLINKL